MLRAIFAGVSSIGLALDCARNRTRSDPISTDSSLCEVHGWPTKKTTQSPARYGPWAYSIFPRRHVRRTFRLTPVYVGSRTDACRSPLYDVMRLEVTRAAGTSGSDRGRQRSTAAAMNIPLTGRIALFSFFDAGRSGKTLPVYPSTAARSEPVPQAGILSAKRRTRKSA